MFLLATRDSLCVGVVEKRCCSHTLIVLVVILHILTSQFLYHFVCFVLFISARCDCRRGQCDPFVGLGGLTQQAATRWCAFCVAGVRRCSHLVRHGLIFGGGTIQISLSSSLMLRQLFRWSGSMLVLGLVSIRRLTRHGLSMCGLLGGIETCKGVHSHKCHDCHGIRLKHIQPVTWTALSR